jgi:conjugative transfer signal peptidase TraF
LILLAGVAGVAGLLAPLAKPAVPLLVWNLTASAPIGPYRLLPADRLQRGDLVVAWPGGAWQDYAARRQYLAAHVPLVKYVAALPGDRVCAQGAELRINGILRVTRLLADGAGRPLPHWQGCRLLTITQILLLNPARRTSFDGRYFGLTDQKDVIGKAVRL